MTVAAVDAISPANSRKNRRRARSAPPSPGAGAVGRAAVGRRRPRGVVPGSAAVLEVGSAMVVGAIAALVGAAVSTG